MRRSEPADVVLRRLLGEADLRPPPAPPPAPKRGGSEPTFRQPQSTPEPAPHLLRGVVATVVAGVTVISAGGVVDQMPAPTPSERRAAMSLPAEAVEMSDASVVPWGPPPRDRGGLIADYIERLSLADRAGVEIALTGTCISACTILLGARRVCVHPEARFWFHAAREGKRISGSATQVAAAYWPAPIREWAKVVGVTKSLDFTPRRSLTGAQLIALGVRRC